MEEIGTDIRLVAWSAFVLILLLAIILFVLKRVSKRKK